MDASFVAGDTGHSASSGVDSAACGPPPDSGGAGLRSDNSGLVLSETQCHFGPVFRGCSSGTKDAPAVWPVRFLFHELLFILPKSSH